MQKQKAYAQATNAFLKVESHMCSPYFLPVPQPSFWKHTRAYHDTNPHNYAPWFFSWTPHLTLNNFSYAQPSKAQLSICLSNQANQELRQTLTLNSIFVWLAPKYTLDNHLSSITIQNFHPNRGVPQIRFNLNTEQQWSNVATQLHLQAWHY